eukprot:g3749.t1
MCDTWLKDHPFLSGFEAKQLDFEQYRSRCVAHGCGSEHDDNDDLFPHYQRWLRAMTDLVVHKGLGQMLQPACKKEEKGVDANYDDMGAGSILELPGLWTRNERVIVHDAVPAHWYKTEEAAPLGTARPVKPFLREKLLGQQHKQWDYFYKNNQANFFKDRHYLGKEFGHWIEESVVTGAGAARGTVCEIGCGVGNTLFPLLQLYGGEGDQVEKKPPLDLDFVVCDHSKVAIDILTDKLKETTVTETTPTTTTRYGTGEAEESSNSVAAGAISSTCKSDVKALVVDATSAAVVEDEAQKGFPPSPLAAYFGKCDVVILLYVLSAIPPGEKQRNVAKLCAKLLRGGTGVLLFRDYAKYDWAQRRFCAEGHKPCGMGGGGPVVEMNDGQINLKNKKNSSEMMNNQQNNLYKRHDGTLAYFFDYDGKELQRNVFTEELGFEKEPLEHKLICREITNRAEKKTMRRLWLQAVFRRSGE